MPVAAAVDDARPDDDGPQMVRGGVEDELLVGRPPGRQRDRVDRGGLVGRIRRLSPSTHTPEV